MLSEYVATNKRYLGLAVSLPITIPACSRAVLQGLEDIPLDFIQFA
jgi:hypothetical protein